MIKEILHLVSFILFFALIAIGIAYGLDRSEKAECYKLQSYSEKYSEFYLTEWQAEMCSYKGVEVNAPVK